MFQKEVFIVLIITFLMNSCNCNKQVETGKKETIKKSVSGYNYDYASAIVYKTTKDYYKNIPIILTSDKKDIASYPTPKDIYYNGELAYPTILSNGYLLDNRGINENVAFTSYTYEEYAKLKSIPSKDELFKKIIDKNPLIQIVNCGARNKYKNEVENLNQLIKAGFPGLKTIKLEVEL